MTAPIIFFDIGNTLGIARVADNGLKSIELFPFVPEILTRLRSQCRLGLLSNTGTETLATMQSVLTTAGIAEFFDPSIQLFSSVEGIDKTNIEFFRLAVQRAGAAASRCVYVSEDDAERAMARNAGMEVSFHPLHVFHVIKSMV
jgi:FMN phosphatase YigB (HAD superfamily)